MEYFGFFDFFDGFRSIFIDFGHCRAKIQNFRPRTNFFMKKKYFFEKILFFLFYIISKDIPKKFSLRWCNLNRTGPGFTAKTLDFAPKLSFFAEGFTCDINSRIYVNFFGFGFFRVLVFISETSKYDFLIPGTILCLYKQKDFFKYEKHSQKK